VLEKQKQSTAKEIARLGFHSDAKEKHKEEQQKYYKQFKALCSATQENTLQKLADELQGFSKRTLTVLIQSLKLHLATRQSYYNTLYSKLDYFLGLIKIALEAISKNPTQKEARITIETYQKRVKELRESWDSVKSEDFWGLVTALEQSGLPIWDGVVVGKEVIALKDEVRKQETLISQCLTKFGDYLKQSNT